MNIPYEERTVGHEEKIASFIVKQNNHMILKFVMLKQEYMSLYESAIFEI